MRVHFKRLRPDAVIPRYMTERAAGMDLCAALDEAIEIDPGQHRAISTGLAMAIEPGWEGQVRPRSGLARDHRVTVLNAPGTIDADYRGECMVLLINHGERPFRVTPGLRIAQLVIAPVAQAETAEVDELPMTARGAGGFGSTGA